MRWLHFPSLFDVGHCPSLGRLPGATSNSDAAPWPEISWNWRIWSCLCHVVGCHVFNVYVHANRLISWYYIDDYRCTDYYIIDIYRLVLPYSSYIWILDGVASNCMDQNKRSEAEANFRKTGRVMVDVVLQSWLVLWWRTHKFSSFMSVLELFDHLPVSPQHTKRNGPSVSGSSLKLTRTCHDMSMCLLTQQTFHGSVFQCFPLPCPSAFFVPFLKQLAPNRYWSPPTWSLEFFRPLTQVLRASEYCDILGQTHVVFNVCVYHTYEYLWISMAL